MRKSLLALAVLGTLSASASVMAADAAPASDFTVTTNVGLFNNYIFRGLTQTAGNAALQGGVDLTHSSGLYVGAWGSNQNWLVDGGAYKNSSIELDIYGGYRGAIGQTGLTYDVGAIYVFFPGTYVSTTAGVSRAETAEIYGALTYSYFTLKVNNSVTDFYGNDASKGSTYFDLTANYPIPAEWTGISGLSAIAHAGRQKVNVSSNIYDYTDYKLGLTKAWENGVSVGGYYTDTTASDSGYGSNLYSYKNLGSNFLTFFATKTF